MGRILRWIALASAAAACASGPANLIAEGQQGAPGVRRVLLCPPNLVLALRSEIQSGSKHVDREVAAYLESQGRTVDRLGLIEGRTLWKQAVALAQTGGSVADAAGIFVTRLAKNHEFDAVVMPSLILHQTRMDANNAAWDGVSRRMKILNAPSQGISREQSTLAKGVAYGGISGPAWVSASAWFGLGRTLVRMGRSEDAFAAFETARRFGWSEPLDVALARIHLERGERERAADLLRPIAQDPHAGPTQQEAALLLEQALPRAPTRAKREMRWQPTTRASASTRTRARRCCATAAIARSSGARARAGRSASRWRTCGSAIASGSSRDRSDRASPRCDAIHASPSS